MSDLLAALLGRFIQAANARAPVENLRDVPPWNGEDEDSADVE